MSRSFQKSTKNQLTLLKPAEDVDMRKLTVKAPCASHINPFKGMSHNIERVPPLVIPGYKVRG